MDNPLVIVLAIALVAAIGVAAWLYMQKRRTDTLQSQFGPEYRRAVAEHKDQREAERELQHRAERVEHMEIRPLAREERDQFVTRWQSVQAQFVDDPSGATEEADELLGRVMATRGYPVGDFEQRAADISVNHPRVVEHYRAGHALALRNARGDADTEDLRQAFVHFRALFEDLLEVESTANDTRHSRTRTEVRR
ncbi:MAG: hypothetical protein AB7P40_24935 [Chloroflexota bacterium]